MSQCLVHAKRDPGRMHGRQRKATWRVVGTGAALVAVLAMGGGAFAGSPARTPQPAAMLMAAERTPGGPDISIKDYAFVPSTIRVPVGTTVTWTNRDGDAHTVTSSAGLFSSPGLDTDEAFSRKFTTPGTYTYFCSIHPHMTATIIVE